MFQLIYLIISEVKIIWIFNATHMIWGKIFENLFDMSETRIVHY